MEGRKKGEKQKKLKPFLACKRAQTILGRLKCLYFIAPPSLVRFCRCVTRPRKARRPGWIEKSRSQQQQQQQQQLEAVECAWLDWYEDSNSKRGDLSLRRPTKDGYFNFECNKIHRISVNRGSELLSTFSTGQNSSRNNYFSRYMCIQKKMISTKKERSHFFFNMFILNGFSSIGRIFRHVIVTGFSLHGRSWSRQSAPKFKTTDQSESERTYACTNTCS